VKINFDKKITPKQLENSIAKEMIENVEKFLKKELYVDKSYKIVIAVSGGIDSTVLLDIFYQVAQKIGFTLYVAHFNHKLRGEASDKDEEFVRQLSKYYNLEFFFATGKVKEFSKKNAMSLETAARVLRYNFFEKSTRTIKADLIATAHTSDDNIETFLINLFRGSGLTGLSGIPKVRQLIKNVRIIRPLINYQKTDLTEYSKLRKLIWREDESNDWLEFTRNKVRHKLIPFIENEFNPSFKDQLNRVTKFLQGADEFISTFIDDYYQSIVDTTEENKVILKIAKLNTFNLYLQGEIISQVLKRNFEMSQINFVQIDRILELKNAETGKICEINKFITCFKDRNQLIFTRNVSPLNVDLIIEKVSKTSIGNFTLLLELRNKNQVKFTEDKNIEYFDYDKLPLTFNVRNWKEGDEFSPLGMTGTKKISDFLIDNKISSFDKNFIYLLATKSEIVWVIGHQINDRYKVTSDTKKVLKATLISNK
jgi:tRNA(Ile)-lysidine synthase